MVAQVFRSRGRGSLAVVSFGGDEHVLGVIVVVAQLQVHQKLLKCII